MNFYSKFILRFAGPILFVGTVLSGVGGYYSIQLFKSLRTDIEELLPATVRSVLDLEEVTRRLESVENLAVLVFSENTQASKKFVTDLGEKLKKVPKDVIASVEYQIRDELHFFKQRRALYMDLPDLIKMRDYVKERIEYERSLYNPLNIFVKEEIPEPQLDLRGMRKKYDKKVSAYSRFPDGYYATPDEKKRVVLVFAPGKASGFKNTQELKNQVVKTIAELSPGNYSPDLEIKFTGGVQNLIEEQSALLKDLGLSTVIVIFLVTFVLFVFFKNTLATSALLLSLFMGAFWTFGVSYFLVGSLNANSAFMGSIIIGNGINFGIIYLARYLEERRKGKSIIRATNLSLTHTATATWTAALAAGLSYGSLMLTSFRGFRQFGVIGLVGMLLCWISSFTLLPALLIFFDKWIPMAEKKFPTPKAFSQLKFFFSIPFFKKHFFSKFLAGLVSRYPAQLWGFSFLLTLISVSQFVFHYQTPLLETDLTKLRNKTSLESGSAYLWKHVDEIFQRYISPLVVLPKTREDALAIEEALKEKKASEGKTSSIASVQSLEDFIPGEQPQKILLLKEIRSRLTPRLLARLSSDDKKLVSEFLTPEAFKPIAANDLPPLVLNKFTEKDKSIGKLILVEPPLDNSLWNGQKLVTFVKDLRQITDSIAPGTPVAGTLPISADLLDAISKDGPKATLLAFLAVVLMVVFFFRNLKTITLVLFALILGATWMGGLMLALGLKINFLNFIALPITFGIGVDYGVNIFQRYQQEKKGDIIAVIKNTGGAVCLCSMTTIIGYSSLLIAENQAFFSFGLLAVLGEITCVTAAILSLPAYLMVMENKKRRMPT